MEDKYHTQSYCTCLCLFLTTLELGYIEKEKRKSFLGIREALPKGPSHQQEYNIVRKKKRMKKLKGCIISAQILHVLSVTCSPKDILFPHKRLRRSVSELTAARGT